MKLNIKLWELSVLLKMGIVFVLSSKTFVKSKGYDGKQHILLLQIIFYDS